jgi:hypothetical protein
MPETAQKYELSFLIACRKIGIGWDGPQFLCISLCWRMLKSMSYPFSEHAEVLRWSSISMHWLMPEPAQKYEVSFLRACRKGDVSWGGLRFLCINLCRRLLKSMSYPFSEHTERFILAVTVFNFYALAYAGDCSQVWVILSQSMQKGWY